MIVTEEGDCLVHCAAARVAFLQAWGERMGHDIQREVMAGRAAECARPLLQLSTTALPPTALSRQPSDKECTYNQAQPLGTARQGGGGVLPSLWSKRCRRQSRARCPRAAVGPGRWLTGRSAAPSGPPCSRSAASHCPAPATGRRAGWYSITARCKQWALLNSLHHRHCAHCMQQAAASLDQAAPHPRRAAPTSR